MKKTTLLFLALFLAAALPLSAAKEAKKTKADSAKKEKTEYSDRIDFSMHAGEAVETVKKQAGSQQAGANAEQKQPAGDSSISGLLGAAGGAKGSGIGAIMGILNAPAHPDSIQGGAAGATYFEIDAMSIARSMYDALDLSFSFGQGDYKNFGVGAHMNVFVIMNDTVTGTDIGGDLFFSFFPMGGAPAGYYFSGLLGARANRIAVDGSPEEFWLSVTPGVETGYRFKFGPLLLDAALVYNAVFSLEQGGAELYHDLQLRTGIGICFLDNPLKEETAVEKDKK